MRYCIERISDHPPKWAIVSSDDYVHEVFHDPREADKVLRRWLLDECRGKREE